MKVSEMLKRYSCMFMAATLIVAGIPQTTARADEPVPYDLTEYETNELPEDHLFGVNVAFQKKVIAEVGHDNVNRNDLVDGNIDSFTEITEPVGVAKEQWQQYFIVDLGKDYVIDRAKVCWRDFGYASEYQIQVATDESVENAGGNVEAANVDWATVGEETDYKAVVDKEEKEYTFAPIAVRYVKLNCTKAGAAYFYHVRELSVYTVGTKTLGGTKLDPNQNNLIDSKTAKIIGDRSSIADPDFPNEHLIDKDESSTYKVNYWNEDTTSHFLLDLGKDTTFNMIKLVPGTGNFWAKRYQFFVATEAEGVAAAGEKKDPIYEEKNGERTMQYCALGKEVTARYIMFKCVEKNKVDYSGIDLNEIELFNVTGVEPTELIVAPSTMKLQGAKSSGQISTLINPVTANKRTVEYTSKDENVAKVDGTGLVTGVGSGDTDITVKITGTNISKDIHVIVGEAIPPVENVTATLADKFAKDVTISWDAVSEAQSYTVRRYKENSAKFEVIAENLKTTTWTDKGLEPGDYSYQIEAIPSAANSHLELSVSARSHSVVIAKDAIGITGTPLALNVNDTKKLTVVLNPTDTTYDDIIWESLDKDGVIELDEKTGKVTGLKVGKAQVKATLADYKNLSTICEVTVGKVNVESIKLETTGLTENKTLGIGEAAKLTATVLPENATYQDLTWVSSEPDVATVSDDGTITTKAVGDTTITVTSTDNPSVSANIHITVIQKNAESIELNESSKTLVLDEKFQLTATVTPITAESKTVKWKSSAEQFASVDENTGWVTANQVGEATITAYCGKVEKTCKIIVERPAPTKISITSSEIMSRMKIGDEINLRISVDPVIADMEVEWDTSDEKIATIDANGKVTACSAGTVTITAKAKKGDQTATTDIVVVKPAITSMDFAEEDKNITMILDTVRVLKPVIAPKEAEQKVTYNLSKDGVVSIDEDGKVKAVGVGTVTVTATSLDEYYEVESTIEVKKPPVEQILTTQSDTAYLVIGETLEVGAATLPEKAENVLDYTSTNPGVATVDPNGTINAVADGQTTIVIAATDESGITTSFDVIVRKPDVSAITLDQSAVTLSVGSSTTLRATVEPALANQAVEWASSNPAVATVDANGNVTALAIGTATITATAEGKVASCTVTAHIPATKLTLNTKKVYIVKGKKLTVKGVMTPANTTDKIKWTTANKKIATVTSKGKIKAKKVGNTTITATTTSGKKVNVKVYVVKQATPSTAIKLNKKKVTIKKGSWYLLSPTLTPSKSTDTIKWKSSKKKVASVDKYGFVTAKKKGKAVITATTKSGKKVECTVTVK